MWRKRKSVHATVFQSEVTAIQHIPEQGTRIKSIAICSDSQAALKTINSAEISSKIVNGSLKALTLVKN